MARPTAIVGKADAADAPQRKKMHHRAQRIVFPDPDRHHKPAKIHIYIREYDLMRQLSALAHSELSYALKAVPRKRCEKGNESRGESSEESCAT